MEEDMTAKEAIRYIEMALAKGMAIENLLGEVLATLRLNVDRGSIVLKEVPTAGCLSLGDIIARWERDFAKLRRVS